MMTHRHDGSEIRKKKQTGEQKMPTAEAASLALTSKILTRVVSGEVPVPSCGMRRRVLW
jgi:hypothetical protein